MYVMYATNPTRISINVKTEKREKQWSVDIVIKYSKTYPIWDFTLKVFTTKIKLTFVNFVENPLRANHCWKLIYANLIVEKHARIVKNPCWIDFSWRNILFLTMALQKEHFFVIFVPKKYFLWKACLKIICKKNMTKQRDLRKNQLGSYFYFSHLDLTGFQKNVKMSKWKPDRNASKLILWKITKSWSNQIDSIPFLSFQK